MQRTQVHQAVELHLRQGGRRGQRGRAEERDCEGASTPWPEGRRRRAFKDLSRPTVVLCTVEEILLSLQKEVSVVGCCRLILTLGVPSWGEWADVSAMIRQRLGILGPSGRALLIGVVGVPIQAPGVGAH